MTRGDRHTVIVGTRSSKLALWQTNHVIARLAELYPGVECRLHTFSTLGDDIVDRPLPELGGKGVFTVRLEAALLAGDVDIAVHSLKDLPIEMTAGLALGAITERADARDVLVTRDGVNLESLPRGAVVGTSSLRRQAQLLLVRPDLVMKPIRGNVETRLRKVADGDYDATVLAAAGVDRLELAQSISERLTLDVMLPAPGQAALAIQCRADDTRVFEYLEPLNCAQSRAAVEAERAFLAGLGGGCSAPVAAYGRIEAGEIHMTCLVAQPDGSRVVRVAGAGADAAPLGRQLAKEAIERGAGEILDVSREALEGKRPLRAKRVVVTRAANQADELCATLSGMGATPLRLPMIEIVPIARQETIRELNDNATAKDWIVFTSANGVSAVWSAMNGSTAGVFDRLRVAAVGTKTASALKDRSVAPAVLPTEFSGETLAAELPDVDGRQVWLLRAETAGEEIVNVLTERGAHVHDVPVYRTDAVPIDTAGLREMEKGVDAILFTSGSTARNFAASCQAAGWDLSVFKDTTIVCIGNQTAHTARALGFDVTIVPAEHTTSAMVDVLADHFSEVTS